MKIAVATMDGTSMSQHFGQSKGFVVYEVEGAEIKHSEWRTNDATPHAQGLCDHGQSGQGQGAHGHTGIVGLLQGCELVLCGGMGAGAAQALAQNGIQAVVLPVQTTADGAVSLYLSGQASPAGAGFCNCQH
jgi:predicted Fe-Mo cluster-binding NifX family protein